MNCVCTVFATVTSGLLQVNQPQSVRFLQWKHGCFRRVYHHSITLSCSMAHKLMNPTLSAFSTVLVQINQIWTRGGLRWSRHPQARHKHLLWMSSAPFYKGAWVCSPRLQQRRTKSTAGRWSKRCRTWPTCCRSESEHNSRQPAATSLQNRRKNRWPSVSELCRACLKLVMLISQTQIRAHALLVNAVQWVMSACATTCF